MIHHKSNDVQMAEKSEYGTGVWDTIDVWQMGRRRQLSSNLQGWSDYNANRKRTGKESEAIVYREYKEGDVSLR